MKDRNEFLKSLKVDTNIPANDGLDIPSFSQNNNQYKGVSNKKHTSPKKKLKKPNTVAKKAKSIFLATILGGSAIFGGKALINNLPSKTELTGEDNNLPSKTEPINTDLNLSDIEILPKEEMGENEYKQIESNAFVSDYNSVLRDRLEYIRNMNDEDWKNYMRDNPNGVSPARLLQILLEDAQPSKLRELKYKCAYSALSDVRQQEGFADYNATIDSYTIDSEDKLIDTSPGLINISCDFSR